MIIGIDVDGVLADIYKYQMEYATPYFKKKYDMDIVNPNEYDLKDIFGCTSVQREKFWLKYIWGYCMKIPMAAWAAEAVKNLHENGHVIYVITGRAHTTEKGITGKVFRWMLKHWMNKNKFYYDKIFYVSEKNSADEKASVCINENVDVLIDDKPCNIHALKDKINVICYDAVWNRDEREVDYCRAENFVEVEQILQRIEADGNIKKQAMIQYQKTEEYYEQLREYVVGRKLETTTKGALTIAPKLKKYVNKLDSFVTGLMAGTKVERITDGLENIPEGAVLFANTHQGILDNLCWIPTNPKHCVMLHASDVSKLLINIQLCTGLVLVNKDKADKCNRIDAKYDMMHILCKNTSIWYFPEGTWNLSPNKLHLPMSYGFLEVAKKAGVPVVPVVTEFTYDTSCDKEKITKIHIRYGKPVYISAQDKLSDKLVEYEERISTLRWELIEEKGLFKRNEITNWDYINFLKGNYRNLIMGKKDIELERKRIRGAGDDFYLFHHINDVPFNERGELL